MGVLGWLRDGCWHHFYATGRRGKRLVNPRDPRGGVVLMVEGKCHCGKTKWIQHYVPGDHGATDTYSTDCFPDLEYV